MTSKQQIRNAGNVASFAPRALRLGGLLACTALLSACVSGTSADVACNNSSRDAPLTGEIHNNVVVPRNATCYLKAHITGDVNAHDGAKVYVLDGTRISGTFRAVGATLVRFNMDESAPVRSARGSGGTVAPQRIFVGSNLVIKEGKLSGASGIAATDIGGNLTLLRNADAGSRSLDHAAAGTLEICTPGVCRPEAQVKVGKSVKIRQNQVAIALGNTAIGADLKCVSNDVAPLLIKPQAGAASVTVRGRKSGQCEHPREVVYTMVAKAPA